MGAGQSPCLAQQPLLLENQEAGVVHHAAADAAVTASQVDETAVLVHLGCLYSSHLPVSGSAAAFQAETHPLLAPTQQALWWHLHAAFGMAWNLVQSQHLAPGQGQTQMVGLPHLLAHLGAWHPSQPFLQLWPDAPVRPAGALKMQVGAAFQIGWLHPCWLVRGQHLPCCQDCMPLEQASPGSRLKVHQELMLNVHLRLMLPATLQHLAGHCLPFWQRCCQQPGPMREDQQGHQCQQAHMVVVLTHAEWQVWELHPPQHSHGRGPEFPCPRHGLSGLGCWLQQAGDHAEVASQNPHRPADVAEACLESCRVEHPLVNTQAEPQQSQGHVGLCWAADGSGGPQHDCLPVWMDLAHLQLLASCWVLPRACQMHLLQAAVPVFLQQRGPHAHVSHLLMAHQLVV